MERILSYARQRDYTKYTSTLKEAWRLSISGLSKSMVEALNSKGHDLELGPDEDYINDSAAQFGIIQAKRHRERGISLAMFLGLMKYYRQSYSDLIRESEFEPDLRFQYEQIIKRFFDRVEIGFCTEWASAKEESIVKELQSNNREMTNEKNKYLTIFESLSMPVFIVGLDGTIENMNHAASKMLNQDTSPGSQYYGEKDTDKIIFTNEFPWLKNFFINFTNEDKGKQSFKKAIRDRDQHFFISFSRSLDVSGKFSNTIVIIEDITKRKNMENELERLATTDPLTGSKNRRSFLELFKQELKRSKRYTRSFALLMMDVDHFKGINDTHGHDMGDKVLKLLVAKSHSVLRDSDIFGRWGGEEFIILLPEIDLHQASSAAERLRGTLAKSELVANDGAIINFTVSIGFTLISRNNLSIDDIIKKADEALFMAKNQGRNRVVLL
jgi:diguanylate cyclase (GGDEF)-like protein